MVRTLYRGTSVFFCIALLALSMIGFASASDRYDYDRYDHNYGYSYDYDYPSYDNSIYHSFNNYGSFNHSYGYPYASYAYPYASYYDYYNQNGYRHDYYRRPTCSISTYRTSGANPYDGRVTVTWWSSNANYAYLSGVGSVATAGTQTMYGSQYSTFTLTVSGPGGSTSCSASSLYYDSSSGHRHGYKYAYNYVANPVFMYPVYSYPYVSGTVYPTYHYVQLSQTPYTGFDFGPVGNAMYWLGMILAAALGAYYIVYSRAGAYSRAFAREVAAAARNHIRLVKAIVR